MRFKDNELVNEVLILLQKIKKDQFATHNKSKMIGLIFGETNFPKEILKKIKKIKKKYLIIDLTKNKIFKKDKNSTSVSLVKLENYKYFKNNNCKKVIFAGK